MITANPMAQRANPSVQPGEHPTANERPESAKEIGLIHTSVKCSILSVKATIDLSQN